ncbi:MAG: cobyrinate a,c-diamide synthase [Psychrilyobacter sp.]|uniref:cobyrinate a,c-diamide synthase n=1 Tax=Psychrilyobacter sp. TaxID=2586924 RepID=UPI003C775E09
MKKILIAGTSSGAGKTTISTAIMGALEGVSPFKAGPDYIDPKFHEFITKNPSNNLDLFMMGEDAVKYIFSKNTKKISIVEGVMGLYDGLNHELDNYSSAHLSRVLDIPVILVVSGKGASTSIAATVLGFKNLDPRVKIRGVILNNVGSEGLYNLLKEGIERYTEIPCVGYFPKDDRVSISERHLGLQQASEIDDLNEKIEILKDMARKYIDLDKILEIAEDGYDALKFKNPAERLKGRFRGKRVGVAKDRAFSFYYSENLKLMEYTGMEIVEFSPTNDSHLPPNLDYIYLGGGYPEIFTKKLYKNNSMMEEIRGASKKIPIYAECGGFMYLTKGIRQLDGGFDPMCGLLDIKVEMKPRLNIKRFGYVDYKSKDGITGRCHEFHYSDIYDVDEKKLYFELKKMNGRIWSCGYEKDKIIAGYPHIHFYGNLEIFVKIFDR